MNIEYLCILKEKDNENITEEELTSKLQDSDHSAVSLVATQVVFRLMN